MGPDQHRLDEQVAAGVEHPFPPQEGGGQGEDQVAAVGVDESGFLHRLQLQRLPQKPGDEKCHEEEEGSASQGDAQAQEPFGAVFHLVGIDDRAGGDAVEDDLVQHHLLAGLQHLQPDQGHPNQQDEQQGGDMLPQQQTQLQTPLPSLPSFVFGNYIIWGFPLQNNTRLRGGRSFFLFLLTSAGVFAIL